MAKEQLSQDAYIQVINNALQAHADYVEGMEVVGLASDHSSLAQLQSFLWEGPDYFAPALQEIIAKISEEYELAS